MTKANTKKYVAVTSGIAAAILAVLLVITLSTPSTALAAWSKQRVTDQVTDDTSGTPVTLSVAYTQKYPECKLLVKVWPRTVDEIDPADIYPEDEEGAPNQEPGHLACDGYWPADSDISYVGNGEKIIANFRVYPAHMDNYNHPDTSLRYWEHFENVIVTFYCDVQYAYHSARVYIEHEATDDNQYLETYVNGEGEIRLLIDKDGEVHDAGIVRVNGLTYFTVVINDEADIDPNIDADISPYSPQTGSNTTVMVMGGMLIASVVAFAITLKRKRQTKDCQ